MSDKCHEKLEKRRLNRPSRYDYEEDPLCGRKPDHKGQHLSEEVMEKARDRVREWKQRNKS